MWKVLKETMYFFNQKITKKSPKNHKKIKYKVI